jgi:hypothetical protein
MSKNKRHLEKMIELNRELINEIVLDDHMTPLEKNFMVTQYANHNQELINELKELNK